MPKEMSQASLRSDADVLTDEEADSLPIHPAILGRIAKGRGTYSIVGTPNPYAQWLVSTGFVSLPASRDAALTADRRLP